MIYVLLVLLIILFFISYLFAGKDFLAPTTISVITFLFSCMMCIYFMWSSNAPYDFHWQTIFLIASAVGMSVWIGIMVHQWFIRIRISPASHKEENISPISPLASVLVILFIMATIIWQLQEIRRIGGNADSFSLRMNAFRRSNSYSTDLEARLPFLLNRFIALVNGLFMIYGFNLLALFPILSLKQRLLNCFVLGLCILSGLLSGGRSSVITTMIAFTILLHLLRIQKQKGYKKYSVATLAKSVVWVCLVLAFFSATRYFVGRQTAMPILDYLSSYYAGPEFILLDQYLQNPPAPSDIFGKYTFGILIRNLRTLGILDIPVYISHLEFRPVGAGVYSNIYTVFRLYHYDFGMFGVYFLHGVASLLISVFYEYAKKRRGNREILVFSLVYDTFVLAFYSSSFYILCSIKFVIEVVTILILYELLIRKRIRLVFRRTGIRSQIVPIGKI